MHDPITREEDADVLADFRLIFRERIIRHRSGRLELFSRLQFPDYDDAEDDWLTSMNPVGALKSAAPTTVREHQLFKSIVRHFERVASAANQALAAAADQTLDYPGFLSLTFEIRQLDGALDRFDAAVTSSLIDVDELTGLLNRVAMERDLARELAHVRREQSLLCLALVDADHFKAVNDTHGHGFGDVVLEELAERFEAALRPRDRVYRYGGEEFLILLPDTNLVDSLQVMDRLRQMVRETTIKDDDIEVTQTVSVGVAIAVEHDDNEAIIDRADKALYKAKASGRNCVMAANS